MSLITEEIVTNELNKMEHDQYQPEEKIVDDIDDVLKDGQKHLCYI